MCYRMSVRENERRQQSISRWALEILERRVLVRSREHAVWLSILNLRMFTGAAPCVFLIGTAVAFPLEVPRFCVEIARCLAGGWLFF